MSFYLNKKLNRSSIGLHDIESLYIETHVGYKKEIKRECPKSTIQSKK
jgi:hypothetical protein